MPDDNPVPVTLESLAAQIKDLSESMNRRFGGVDARFGGVDARFDAIDARFDAIDARFGGVDAQFDAIDTRFDAVEAKIDKSETETRSQLGVKIEAVDARVKLVYDVLVAQQGYNNANETAHEGFASRLENHDLRIVALEHRNPSDR